MAQKIYTDIEKDTNYSIPYLPTGWSKDGYTFSSWNTLANGTGTKYSPGDIIVMNQNKTLYAQWINDTNTISYLFGPTNTFVLTTVAGSARGDTTGIALSNTRPLYDYSSVPNTSSGVESKYTVHDSGKNELKYRINLTGKLKRYICIEDEKRILRDRTNGCGTVIEYCLIFENNHSDEKDSGAVNCVVLNFTSTIMEAYQTGTIGADGKTNEEAEKTQTCETNEKFIIDLTKCTVCKNIYFNSSNVNNEYCEGLSIACDDNGYAYLKFDGSGAHNGFNMNLIPIMYLAVAVNDHFKTTPGSTYSDYGSETLISNIKVRTNSTGSFN